MSKSEIRKVTSQLKVKELFHHHTQHPRKVPKVAVNSRTGSMDLNMLLELANSISKRARLMQQKD
jgi:hypothetical protein